MTNGSGLTGDELRQAGAVFTPDSLYATANCVAADASPVVDAFEPAFFSSSISDVDVRFSKFNAVVRSFVV